MKFEKLFTACEIEFTVSDKVRQIVQGEPRYIVLQIVQGEPHHIALQFDIIEHFKAGPLEIMKGTLIN